LLFSQWLRQSVRLVFWGGAAFWALVFGCAAQAQAQVQGQATSTVSGSSPILAAQAVGGEGVSGRMLAGTCANCHGTDGRSAGGMPNLAGYSRDAMVASMRAFRGGQRPATIMHQHAKGYTDEQLALIAGYFAAVTPGRAAAAPAVR
jgi:cytochrome c553